MRCSIPNTVQLVINQWSRAETETASEIKQTHHRAGEEFITEFFTNVLSRNLKTATRDGAVARAFEMDLVATFPSLYHGDFRLKRFSDRLFMNCERHSKQRESKGGGDFGLTVVRPSLRIGAYVPSITMERQGLLCQAKLRTARGPWRQLSPNQCKVLPVNFPFATLILYEYADRGRRALRPFKWQPCENADIADVIGWLKNDTFPQTRSSSQILWMLAEEQIGTSDERTIEEKVVTESRPCIEIRIDWPDDAKPPPLSELLKIRSAATQKIYVYNR